MKCPGCGAEVYLVLEDSFGCVWGEDEKKESEGNKRDCETINDSDPRGVSVCEDPCWSSGVAICESLQSNEKKVE